MINLISALTLSTKLIVCIAIFAVLIVAEILTLVLLVRWKKNYKKATTQDQSSEQQNTSDTTQPQTTTPAVLESQDNENNNTTQESVDNTQESSETAQTDAQETSEPTDDKAEVENNETTPVETVEESAETAQPVENAEENVEIVEETSETVEETIEDVQEESRPVQDEEKEEQKKDDKSGDNKWSAFAFAPFMLLSATSQVLSLRYVLYALIAVSVLLAAVVLTTAVIFKKALQEEDEEPARDFIPDAKPEEPPVEEPVQEDIPEAVLADEVTAEEVEEPAEEQPVEEQPVEEEPVQEEPVEQLIEEEVVEEYTEEEVVEEQPIQEEVVEEPIEEQPAEEETVVEEPPVEEPVEEPVKEEPKPRTKRPPVPREQTMVIDDVALVIKDDRFLFNPSDDGYYYILEKTFTAKLIQSEEYVKDYYTELKNELLSYKKIHARMSKKRESFNFGRVCLARLTIRGKTLRLHLALDAKDYEETKYKVEDTSNIKSLADTALMYRIKNDRRLKYAKDLIATVMAKYGVVKQEIEPVDYTSMYPYEETPPLIERGLIIRRRAKGKVPEGNGFDFAQKTFKAKLIQADDVVKEYYSQLKNALLSYRKVHDRMSKKRESFRFGRTCVARMTIRGKTLRLYLALDANDYVDTKYKVEDASEVKSVADTPLLMKIKNPRRLKYALELIDVAMANVGTTKKREADETDYVADLPFESLEDLMEKGLVTNVHVESNSFVAQHFSFKQKDEDEDEVAADEE